MIARRWSGVTVSASCGVGGASSTLTPDEWVASTSETRSASRMPMCGTRSQIVLAGGRIRVTAMPGSCAVISCVAVMPSISGIVTSISTTSGLWLRASSTASRPVPACPTTWMSPANCSSFWTLSRASGTSSAIRTRIFWPELMVALHPRVRRRTPIHQGTLYEPGLRLLLAREADRLRRRQLVVGDEHVDGDAVGLRRVVVLLAAQGEGERAAVVQDELHHLGLLVGHLEDDHVGGRRGGLAVLGLLVLRLGVGPAGDAQHLDVLHDHLGQRVALAVGALHLEARARLARVD